MPRLYILERQKLGGKKVIKIEINAVDSKLADLIQDLGAVGQRSMPVTEDAFRYAATKLILPAWKSVASGNPFGGIRLKSPSGGYAASIKAKQISPFNWVIYSSAKVAEFLEHGTKRVDFKETHTKGKKSRVAYKKGEDGEILKVGYLIVPFRHATPGARGNPMPETIYKTIRAKIKSGRFQKSVVEKAPAESGKLEPNWPGELIPRATYSWGSKFRQQGLKREFANLEGMVVFDVGSSRAMRSTYFTFRVISAESPPGSWIKPATPPLHITKAVVNATMKDIEDLIRYGLEKDLGL
ncbi:hypothetical protein ES708_21361 [subsurface metagenome]